MGQRGRLSALLCTCILLAGYIEIRSQEIPPSAFILTDFSPSPPPPPPPPPASAFQIAGDGIPPPPPVTPAASPQRAKAASSPDTTGSSSLSGGAIAGIVVGAIAGLAIVAAVATLLCRRKKQKDTAMSTLPVKEQEHHSTIFPVDLGPGNLNINQKSITLQPGLSWKEGDEVRRDTSLQPGIASSVQRDLEPLSSNTTSQKQISAGQGSDSYVQVLRDNTPVVVQRGPGGSVKVVKTADKAPPLSGGGLSVLSSGSENSQAVSLHSGFSRGPGSSVSGTTTTFADLPELPWSDWEIKADDILISKDENGEPLKLGSGAYGTVYKATIDGVTEVAVKIFHDVHDHPQQADILREVAILKGCRDRNIVQFLGACIMDERIMLVTELMESGDLWHALLQFNESGALKWYRRGRRIAIEIARGLHFLHRHKIIHFDLKSANVLLTREGTAKISDVGFANILSNTHLSNNQQAFTFAWAAPEDRGQLRMQVLMGVSCSDKVDIFSYGVLLWELVTGQQPRRGQMRDCRVPEECPAEVDELIQRCLSFEPEQRPTCKEIVQILSASNLKSAPLPKLAPAPATA